MMIGVVSSGATDVGAPGLVPVTVAVAVGVAVGGAVVVSIGLAVVGDAVGCSVGVVVGFAVGLTAGCAVLPSQLQLAVEVAPMVLSALSQMHARPQKPSVVSTPTSAHIWNMSPGVKFPNRQPGVVKKWSIPSLPIPAKQLRRSSRLVSTRPKRMAAMSLAAELFSCSSGTTRPMMIGVIGAQLGVA